MSDTPTTGWKNARKTINGREYVIGGETLCGKTRWWVCCDDWYSQNYSRLADAKREAHRHAEENPCKNE